MTLPSPQEARSRQTAMEAERHWWVTKLRAYLSEVEASRIEDRTEANEFSMERASVKDDFVEDLCALIAERTR